MDDDETTNTEVDYNPVWAIVVVSFLLIVICMLSVSFYFSCQLYRNERRRNRKLQQSLQLSRRQSKHNGSKTSDQHTLLIEDEYAPIPGDIGHKVSSHGYAGDDTPMEGHNDDDYLSTTMSQKYGVRRRSFKKSNAITMSTSSVPSVPPKGTKTMPKRRRPMTISEENVHGADPSVDADDYAFVDQISMHKKEESITIPLKPSKRNRKSPRRYSYDLELSVSQRKRRSPRTSYRYDHSVNQTQDDMIFLSITEYFDMEQEGMDRGDEDDDRDDVLSDPRSSANHLQKERISRQFASKDDFAKMANLRAAKLVSVQEIKYEDIHFGDGQVLGKGRFGQVVRAKYHQIDVAVKRLHTQKLSGPDLINFKREAAIMQKVGGHKHIARIYGFCTKPEICIVTEYYSRGSVRDILNRHQHIPTKRRLQMSIEAALGIWHLHQQQVIHRDISARNLLVDENWGVVVADLGMSTLKKTAIRGIKSADTVFPVKWMAPESFAHNMFSEKSDSYSFGITLFEIFTDSEPYPGRKPLEVGSAVAFHDLRPKVDGNHKIAKVPKLADLLKKLWRKEPAKRPDFKWITDALQQIKKEHAEFLKWEKSRNRKEVKIKSSHSTMIRDDDQKVNRELLEQQGATANLEYED